MGNLFVNHAQNPKPGRARMLRAECHPKRKSIELWDSFVVHLYASVYFSVEARVGDIKPSNNSLPNDGEILTSN